MDFFGVVISDAQFEAAMQAARVNVLANMVAGMRFGGGFKDDAEIARELGFTLPPPEEKRHD